MGVRSTAKAIILNEGKILLNRCTDVHNGTYCTLPGGGQNQYEPLCDAVARECLEETGYTVEAVRFAGLCEEICDDLAFRQSHPEYGHKMLHLFVCRLVDVPRRVPTEQDSKQTGCEWVELDRLGSIHLLPETVGKNLRALVEGPAPLFLGCVHTAYNHG